MTAISDKYKQLGGAAGFLGQSSTSETTTPDGVGKFQHFKGGSIYWHPSTGAWSVRGSIFARWAFLEYERGPLGYPIADEAAHGVGGRISKFQRGIITWSPNPLAEFLVYSQNMALLPEAPLPPFFPYKGVERSKAIAQLIAALKLRKPHVVGLSEVFKDGERAHIRQQLAGIYVDSISGPDEDDIESDGGLMLMSRTPILARAGSIFRQTASDDSFANKGILHARVQPTGLPVPLDVFLTHTQNPDASGLEKERNVVKQQLEHCRAFILASRHPESPAIFLGDINTDLNNAALKQDLMQRLQFPYDLWSESGDKAFSPLGITEDHAGSFLAGRPLSPPNSPTRHKQGKRLDGLLTWNGNGIWPVYSNTEVVVEQSSPGRDISDHYGVRTKMVSFQSLPVTITSPITKVSVTLSHFHCLEETDEVGDDSMYFHLACKTQNGQNKTAKTGTRNGVASGEQHTVASPVTHVLTDPGLHLDIEVTGMEYDAGSPNDLVGKKSIRISRNELLQGLRRTVVRALPRLTEDGGEYVVYVTIKVE